jgi:hypothetical protein
MVVTMTMVVVPVLVFVVSIGVAVTVTMIFPAPRTLTVMPPVRPVLVVRTGPICAGIGRLRVVSGNPTIVLAMGLPEAAYPDESGFRRGRRWGLITNRRRCYADIDGDLRPGWRRESCCNNSESHTLFEHAVLSLIT